MLSGRPINCNIRGVIVDLHPVLLGCLTSFLAKMHACFRKPSAAHTDTKIQLENGIFMRELRLGNSWFQ